MELMRFSLFFLYQLSIIKYYLYVFFFKSIANPRSADPQMKLVQRAMLPASPVFGALEILLTVPSSKANTYGENPFTLRDICPFFTVVL